jgi:hypothetical protein
MQEHYVHGLPPKNASTGIQRNEDTKRLAIVLRRGHQVHQKEDNGVPCLNLEPRKEIFYIFGDTIEQLSKGATYSRQELRSLGAHG